MGPAMGFTFTAEPLRSDGQQEQRESLITHSIPATVLADMKAQTQNRSKPSTTRANRNPEVRELKALPSAGDLIVTGNEYDLGIAPSVQNQADIGLAVGALITTGQFRLLPFTSF